MRNQLLRPLMIALSCIWLTGCDKLVEFMRYTADERAAAESLKPIRDPVSEEIYRFRVDTRQAYDQSRFDELERIAAEARATKLIFSNGSWKIVEFYESLACREDEPESMWELHDQIHRKWIAAKPQSITAQVAYADFLTEYGWHARGHGFAKDVPPENWKPFKQRVGTARKIIEETRLLAGERPLLCDGGVRCSPGPGLAQIPLRQTGRGSARLRALFLAIRHEAGHLAFAPMVW